MGDSKKNRLAFLLSALILAAVLFFTPLWSVFQGVVQPILVPIVSYFYKLGNNITDVFQSSKVVGESNTLRQELISCQSEKVQANKLKEENDRLRALLSLPKITAFTQLGAEVIGRSISETETSYLINRGQADGVEIGWPVVASSSDGSIDKAILVGTVQSVTEHLSTIALVTSNNSHILAQVVNRASSQGVATGEYNLALHLQYIPLDDQLEVGSWVVTSNLDPKIPAGLLLGKITQVEKRSGELFQAAVVAPPVNLDRFQYLFLLSRS